MNIPLFPIVAGQLRVAEALGDPSRTINLGATLNLDFENQEYFIEPLVYSVRFYPFDFAPQPGTSAYAVPYAVWQVVTGLPENYLGCPPDIDSYSLQIDLYGGGVTEVQAAVKALRDALEPHGYITRWGNEEREEETGLYRYGFDFDFWVKRE